MLYITMVSYSIIISGTPRASSNNLEAQARAIYFIICVEILVRYLKHVFTVRENDPSDPLLILWHKGFIPSMSYYQDVLEDYFPISEWKFNYHTD